MTDYTQIDSLTDEDLQNVLVDLELEVGGNSVGTMTLEMWPQTAPATVRNFVRYAAEGLLEYDA